MQRMPWLLGVLACSMPLLAACQSSAPAASEVRPLKPAATDLLPRGGLTGWRRVPLEPLADKAVWSPSPEGLLLIDGASAKEMLLHETELGDGVLHVEWRFRPQAVDKPTYNGGVYVRTALDGKAWVQLQVAHLDKPPVSGDLIAQVPGQEKRVEVFQAGNNPVHPPGEWNTYDVTLRGPTISVDLNGQHTVTWSDCPLARGHVGLQAEGAWIEVRSFSFQPL